MKIFSPPDRFLEICYDPLTGRYQFWYAYGSGFVFEFEVSKLEEEMITIKKYTSRSSSQYSSCNPDGNQMESNQLTFRCFINFSTSNSSAY